MLVLMAGLPGTGKSAISAALEETLPGFRLDKDTVRAALFRDRVDYTGPQNDLCLQVMYEVAGYLFSQGERYCIIDGRTFSKRAHLEQAREAAARLGTELRILECICSEGTARERIEASRDSHVAKDRTFEMYLRVKAEAEPLPAERLVLDTDVLSLPMAVARAAAYLRDEL
jgi:adenylylsulfate kinase